MLLGPQCNTRYDRHFIRKSTAIVVNEPSKDEPIVLGVYSKTFHQNLRPYRFGFSQHVQTLSGRTTYYSFAHLTGISCVYLFEDSKNGFCRGILFEYTNGGSRAVGQCRLHIDTCTEYKLPSTICSRITQTEQGLDRVQVKVGRCVSNHSEELWNCWSLSKTVHFWFSEESTLLSVM